MKTVRTVTQTTKTTTITYSAAELCKLLGLPEKATITVDVPRWHNDGDLEIGGGPDGPPLVARIVETDEKTEET